MNKFFPLRNTITESVTDSDYELLVRSCIALKSLSYLTHALKDVRFPSINCHSLARFLTIIYKETRLIDGVLLGLEPLATGQMQLVQTDHSWVLTPDGSILEAHSMAPLSNNGVVLIPTIDSPYRAHGANLYRKDPSVLQRFDVKESWNNARALYRILKENTTNELVDQIVNEIVMA